MIHSILQILFFVWPFGCWTANLFLPGRLHPVLLYIVVVIFGCLLLVASVITLDSYLESELDRFDLNSNGKFEDFEITPASRKAIDNFTNLHEGTPPQLLAAPITAIWALITFAILYFCEWEICILRGMPVALTITPAENTTVVEDSDPNPYRPPNDG